MVLGKHSGRHALAAQLAEMNCKVDEDQLEKLHERLTQVADSKAYISESEVADLATETLQAGCRSDGSSSESAKRKGRCCVGR